MDIFEGAPRKTHRSREFRGRFDMNRRLVAVVAAAGLTMGLLATLGVAQGALVQKPAAKATSIKPSGIPRAADGKPDLSGVFSNAQSIPIQRAANLGEKEFY